MSYEILLIYFFQYGLFGSGVGHGHNRRQTIPGLWVDSVRLFFSFGKIQLLILCNSGLMKQNMRPSPARERTPTVRRPSTPDMRETNTSWVASGSVQWPAVETKRPRPDELLSTPGCTKEKRQRLSGWRLPLKICPRAMRIFEL